MAREQPLPHLDPPKIEPQPLSQAHDFVGLLGYAAGNDDLTRFLSYAIAVLHAARPWEDERKKLRPYWAGFTPRAMAAEHARTIKQQRRAKRTGQDDHLRRKLEDANLAMALQASGLLELGWQGKFRGLNFEPALYRIERLSSPDIVDIHGREILIPIMRPATAEDDEARQRAACQRWRERKRARALAPA